MKALVTGASSGIGRCSALYLSSFGYDLYVVSRNKSELEKIFEKVQVKVECLEFDLRKEEDCSEVYEQLKDKDIDIVVNNAGFGDCGNFTETSLEKEMDMINLNVCAYHILMKLFLRDFTKRGYGRILNIASMAGFMPGPYMATYYATKSYIVNLSLAVSEELKQQHSNVKISCFCPGPVKTNFSSIAHVHFNIGSLTAEQAAHCAIDGMFQDKTIIIPNNMKLNYVLTKVAPISLILMVNSKIQERASK